MSDKPKIWIGSSRGPCINIEAEIVQDHLAVNQSYSIYNEPIHDEYTVTHLITGFRICHTATVDRARDLMEQLAHCGLDWSLGLQEILEAEKELNLVKPIIQAAKKKGWLLES